MGAKIAFLHAEPMHTIEGYKTCHQSSKGYFSMSEWMFCLRIYWGGIDVRFFFYTPSINNGYIVLALFFTTGAAFYVQSFAS